VRTLSAGERREWLELWQAQLASEVEAACGACPDLSPAERRQRLLHWLNWRLVEMQKCQDVAPEVEIALGVLEGMRQRVEEKDG